ncbi:A-kinase-interacting protein 1 isoform X2 [Pseudophryne corroboree]|uniref:A-kinase-interacting protein 1 isoform X2 n=1 Tax=Pseudophryne corroboree TaxID=495146 RepID=UPI003081A708
MTDHGRMEDSLRRTSQLGREVLERARRRDMGWWSSYENEGLPLGAQHGKKTPEEEERNMILEEAFCTLSHFMCRTTEQCERYHSCLPLREIDGHAKQHALRFHCRKSQPVALKTDSRSWDPRVCTMQSSVAASPQYGPCDVYIEVAPGTYSISGGSSNGQKQTHVVNITPGQSVDLTFNG